MEYLNRWSAVPPQSIVANGTADGRLQVPDATLFKVGMNVNVFSDEVQPKPLQIKKVISAILIQVCDPSNFQVDVDLTSILITDNSKVSAGEQARIVINSNDSLRAVFEETPTNAIRSFLVDILGNKYSTSNPVPVQLSDGSLNIGTVNQNLDVQLTSRDNDPASGDVHDSLRIGGPSGHEADVTAGGALLVQDVSNTATSSATTPTIANIVVSINSVEQSYALPANTIRFTMKVRSNQSDLQVAYAPGQSSSDYISVPKGIYYHEESLNPTTSFTLYFQTSKDTQIVEISSWANQ